MKSVIVALLATLLGAAMLGIGIAGVAGAFDGDDDDSGSSSSSSVTNFDDCPASDPRFSAFTTYRVTGPAGTATVVVSCRPAGVEVSVLGSGLTTGDSRTVSLWLYNNRKDALLIGSDQQLTGDETVAITGRLPAGSEAYKKLVVTEGPPSTDYEDPEKPGRVILQVRI